MLKHGHSASPSARLSLEMVREDALAGFPSMSLRIKFVFPGAWTVSEICVLDSRSAGDPSPNDLGKAPKSHTSELFTSDSRRALGLRRDQGLSGNSQ